MAAGNPFRFSTKYQDEETGLLYYGYRYYDPNRGRWLSRDPIGESGGWNLFSLSENSPPDKIDPLGLSVIRLLIDRWIGLSNRNETRGTFLAFPDDNRALKCCGTVSGETLELPKGRYELDPFKGVSIGPKPYPIPDGNYRANWALAVTTGTQNLVGAQHRVPPILGNENLDFLDEGSRGFGDVRGHIGTTAYWSRGCVIFGCNPRAVTIPLESTNLPDDQPTLDKKGNVPVYTFSIEDSVSKLADLAKLVDCVTKATGERPTFEISIAWRDGNPVPRAIPVRLPR